MLAAALASPPRAHAGDEASAGGARAQQAWRTGVERSWAHGQLDALDTASPVGAEPPIAFVRWLRDGWWRRGRISGLDAVKPTGDALLDARLAWLRAGGRSAYPVDDHDPWPVLTALVQDRQQRETDPLDDPTRAFDAITSQDPWIARALDGAQIQLEVYLDTALEAANEEARQEGAAIQSAAWRRVWLALLALLTLTALAAWGLGRGRSDIDPTAPQVDTPDGA